MSNDVFNLSKGEMYRIELHIKLLDKFIQKLAARINEDIFSPLAYSCFRYDLEVKTDQEIAEISGLSVAYVKDILFIARTKYMQQKKANEIISQSDEDGSLIQNRLYELYSKSPKNGSRVTSNSNLVL